MTVPRTPIQANATKTVLFVESPRVMGRHMTHEDCQTLLVYDRLLIPDDPYLSAAIHEMLRNAPPGYSWFEAPESNDTYSKPSYCVHDIVCDGGHDNQ